MRARKILPIFVAMAVIARLVGLVYGPVDIDETDCVAIGRMLRFNEWPYLAVGEKKPIFMYLFYVPSAVFGVHMWPMQLLAMAWWVATAWLCGRATERWTASAEAGVAAGVVTILAAAANLGSVNAELMANLPLAWAIYAYVRHCEKPSWRGAAEVGLAVGVASLFKHQYGIALAAFGLAELWTRGLVGVGYGLGMGLTFAAPWVVVAGGYVAAGHGAEFYEWNVRRNLAYSGIGAGSKLLRFVASFAACVLGGAALWWGLAIQRLRHAKGDSVARGVGLLLWLTWVPVSMGGRFYEHYFLEFVTPLAVLAGAGAAELWRARATMRAGKRRALYVLAFAPAILWVSVGWGRGLAHDYPNQEPRTIEIAAWLRAHAGENDRMLVWGHWSPLYYASGVLPGTRYVFTAVHVGDFDPSHLPPGFDLHPYVSTRDEAFTIHDLDTRKPRFIVDTAPADIHHWSKVPLSLFPNLTAYIAANYRVAAMVAGAPIYERN